MNAPARSPLKRNDKYLTSNYFSYINNSCRRCANRFPDIHENLLTVAWCNGGEKSVDE